MMPLLKHHSEVFRYYVLVVVKISSGSGVVNLPMTFTSSEAGRFPCRILLRHGDDIRIFCVSCTVVPEGNITQIEFANPVNECIVQNVPIVSDLFLLCITK